MRHEELAGVLTLACVVSVLVTNAAGRPAGRRRHPSTAASPANVCGRSREVRQSLNRSLLNRMTGDASRRAAHSARLYDLLPVNDFAGLAVLFESFFASIPYEWYTNNDIAGYEGFYASVFYSYFAGLGLNVTVEDSSSHGRLDMALRFNGAHRPERYRRAVIVPRRTERTPAAIGCGHRWR